MSNYTSYEALDQDYEDKLSIINQDFTGRKITAADRALAVGRLNDWYDLENDKIEPYLHPEED